MSVTTGTFPGVRIVDMPDLGPVTANSSMVGEHAGSGRFTANALAAYVGVGMHVRQFGAVGDGVTDDAPAIKAAVAAAVAAHVSRVIFEARTYAIGSQIVLGNGTTSAPSKINSISLIGAGSQFVRLDLPNNLADVGTQLKWIGPAGDTMLYIKGPCFGIDVRHIGLNCNYTAGAGLLIESGSHGNFPNIVVANYTHVGVALTTIKASTLSGYSGDSAIIGTQGNIFTSMRLNSLHPGAFGLVLDGYPGDGVVDGLDTTMNTFTNTFILMDSTANTVGLYLGYCDFNLFEGIIFARFGGADDGTAPSIRVQPVVTSPSNYPFPQINTFAGLTDLGTAGFVQIMPGPTMGSGMVIDNISSLGQEKTIRAPENGFIKFSTFDTGLFPTGGFWSDGGLHINERGLRNKLMNASMARATRGTSISVNTTNTYTLDGYKVECNGTFNVNISRLPFTPGQTSVPYGPRYFMRFNPTTITGAGYIQLSMPVPDVALYAGRQTVFSAWMVLSTGASASVNVGVSQVFGSGGSPVTTTLSATGALSLTPQWKRYAWVISLPSITGKTLTADGRHWVEVIIGLPTTAGYTVDIALPQWEAGIVDTAFEIRPDAIDEVLCGRFLRRAGMGMTGGASGATGAGIAGTWPAMWATPTASLISGTAVNVTVPGDAVHSAAAPVFGVNTIGPAGGAFDLGGFAGMTAFRPVLVTNDFLYISAEP